MSGSDKDIISNSDYRERTTWVTRKIRTLKLDELPQIINIYKKDVAFFGPRPLKNVSKVSDEVKPIFGGNFPVNRLEFRQSVRPGIVGLAQVLKLDHNQARRRFAADVFFIQNNSFWLRFKILCLLFRSLINQKNEEFSLIEDQK